MFLKATQLTFVLALLMGVKAHSQKIDSLKNELLRQNGEERFSTLYDLVFEYLDKGDYQEALKYIDEAQQVAARYDDSLHVVKAGRVKGQILYYLDRSTDAINEFQKVLPVSERNKFNDDCETILNALAVAYTFQANYDKALKYHFECLSLREKRGNQEDISTTLTNIGLVYYKLLNCEKALAYYKRALSQSEKFEFKDQLLINIGLCHNYLKDYTSALKFIREGMRLCEPKCTDDTIMSGEIGLGLSLFGSGKPKEAEKHLLASYVLAKKLNDKRFQIENLIYLARVKKAAGLYGAAKQLLKQAESIQAETQYNELLIDIYEQFSKLFIATRDYRNAVTYQTKYITLKDSIHSGELTKNLMRIQADYEERENKARIASQEQILRLNEEVIAKQRFLNFLTGTVAILFVLLTLIFFKLSRQRKRMNSLLDRKVEERTLALEESLKNLQRSHDEQETLLSVLSSDIKASVATIRGLCTLSSVLEDKPGTRIRYVKEFEETAGRIAEIVNRVQRISKR